MTVPSGPTPATLDAAVEAGTVAHHDRFCLSQQSDWHRDDNALECVASYRPAAERVILAAAPILAAADADQLALAHAAGTAAGAAAERERIAQALEAEARKPLVYSQTALRAAAAIARAGTSGDAS